MCAGTENQARARCSREKAARTRAAQRWALCDCAKFSDGANQNQTVTIIDPKASNPKAENIDIDEFNSVWNGTGLIFKKSRRLRQESGEISVGAI